MGNGSVVHAANISFDKETGIGNWSREYFIKRFKVAADSGYACPLKNSNIQTVMPWTSFAQMKESDLGAM